MSSILEKRQPFEVFFIFGNKKKSHVAIYGEYRGWGMTTVLFLAKNYEQATTKFASFRMNFAATRFMPRTFEKNVMTSAN
jgi:hypothetical protein